MWIFSDGEGSAGCLGGNGGGRATGGVGGQGRRQPGGDWHCERTTGVQSAPDAGARGRSHRRRIGGSGAAEWGQGQSAIRPAATAIGGASGRKSSFTSIPTSGAGFWYDGGPRV